MSMKTYIIGLRANIWLGHWFLPFSWKPPSKSNCICSSKWNNCIKASISAWLQSHSVPCCRLIVDGLRVFQGIQGREHLPIILYYEAGRKRITWMVVAKGFFFWLRRMATQWNRKETQSVHVREMINSELHYWKASLIRCSHLPGEPAQDCRLGSHCCFFSLQEISS